MQSWSTMPTACLSCGATVQTGLYTVHSYQCPQVSINPAKEQRTADVAPAAPKPSHWHIKETLRTLATVAGSGAATSLLEFLHAHHAGEVFRVHDALELAAIGAAIAVLGLFQRVPGAPQGTPECS